MAVTVKLPMAVDVSYYEPVSDWSLANPQPSLIIGRASYGIRKDTHFISHMKQAADLGIPRAAYHYLYATPLLRGQTIEASIGDQADNFIEQLELAKFSKVETIWMDWEAYGNEKAPGGQRLQRLLKQFLDHVEREWGVRPGIYSRKDQLDRMKFIGTMPDWINDYSYWFAWYPYYPDQFPEFPVENTRLWPSYIDPRNLAMWQYSEHGLIMPKEGMDDRRQTTFDLNMMYPWFRDWVGDVQPPQVKTEAELAEEYYWKIDPLGQWLPIKKHFISTWMESAKVDRCN